MDSKDFVEINNIKEENPISNLLNDYKSPFESLIFAENITDKLIQKTVDLVYSKTIDKKLEGFSIEYCFDLLIKTANLKNIKPDPGEITRNMTDISWKERNDSVTDTIILTILEASTFR